MSAKPQNENREWVQDIGQGSMPAPGGDHPSDCEAWIRTAAPGPCGLRAGLKPLISFFLGIGAVTGNEATI